MARKKRLKRLKKVLLAALTLLLIAIPSAYPTQYYTMRFKSNIIKACKGCDYWLSCSTSSMHPTFNCNDTLLLETPTSKRDIKVGDIVWYAGTKHQLSYYDERGVKYIVHRIVGMDHKGCYITRGDNNHYDDTYNPCFYDIRFKVRGVIYDEH